MNSISENIDENINMINSIFSDSKDIIRTELRLGRDGSVRGYAVFIEVTVGNLLVENTVVGKLLNRLCTEEKEALLRIVETNSLGIADVTLFTEFSEVVSAVLGGNIVIFLEGIAKAVKVQDKGYPRMSLQQAGSEKSLRGSNEAFSDSVKVNTALIRKRLRTHEVKVLEKKSGVRSDTSVDIMYIEGIAYPELVNEIERRIDSYEIDSIQDSGVLEQLAEEKWYSPFPQFQTTERPDRAAMAMLEGRIVVLCDNSPVALVLPADYSSFIRTADDYYARWEIASLGRIIRYIAAVLAMTAPGLYLAVTEFHSQLLPTSLLLSFAAARQGVPFPAIVEVLIMELSFELLREAGVRLPGTMGNTIGIVGGLIIGQAAVDANIVSPIVVIVVAFTALCSFSIPNEEFASAFRILKFAFIVICGWLGFFGFIVGITAVLIHLSHLKSFGVPYLMPFCSDELNSDRDRTDMIFRFPTKRQKYRPVYARNKIKLKQGGK